jgi:hypothetical protein
MEQQQEQSTYTPGTTEHQQWVQNLANIYNNAYATS